MSPSDSSDPGPVVDALAGCFGIRLVKHAMTRTGIRNTDGGTGVGYPDGDPDTAHIRLRNVEIRFSYWTQKFQVTETEYLTLLAGRFMRDSLPDAASEIERFITLLPSLPAAPYMPVPELLEAILRAFPVDDVVWFSLSRRSFQIGKYGCGLRYHGEDYSPGYREMVHLCQDHGQGATLPEGNYLAALHSALDQKGEFEAAAKIKTARIAK